MLVIFINNNNRYDLAIICTSLCKQVLKWYRVYSCNNPNPSYWPSSSKHSRRTKKHSRRTKSVQCEQLTERLLLIFWFLRYQYLAWAQIKLQSFNFGWVSSLRILKIIRDVFIFCLKCVVLGNQCSHLNICTFPTM